MATVFDNGMTAHVWAQFTQPEGRSHNGNFYFEGRALYSYGTHYVAAYLLPAPGNPEGVGVALINSESRSVSTSRHCGYAADAARHHGRIWIPNVTELARLFRRAGCYGNAARKIAADMGPALSRHFADPDNLPDDGRNARAERTPRDYIAAVAAIFAAAQCDNPERRARAAVAKAERATLKAAEREAKADRDSLLRTLALTAGRDPGEIAARMEADARRVAGKGSAPEQGRAQWEESGREIFRAIKAGNAAGRVAQVRKAKAVRKAIRDNLPAFERADMRARKRETWATRKADLRTAVANAAAFQSGGEARLRVVNRAGTRSGTRSFGAYDMGQGAAAARAMAGTLARQGDDARTPYAAPACRLTGGDPDALAGKLRALADTLDSIAAESAIAERRAERRRELSAIRAAATMPEGEGDATERATRFGNVAGIADRYAATDYRPTGLYPVPGAWRVVGWTPERFAELRDKLKAEESAARAELRAIAERETERARALALSAWREGDAIPREIARHTPRALPDGSAYLRATGVERDAGEITGGTLETSQGARVPLTHALRAFRFLKAVRDRGEGWQANGRTLRVGHFAIERIESDGTFKAGCHRIAWGEVSALAERLGVANLAPADTTEERARA